MKILCLCFETSMRFYASQKWFILLVKQKSFEVILLHNPFPPPPPPPNINITSLYTAILLADVLTASEGNPKNLYFLILSNALIKNSYKILTYCHKLLCQHILHICCLEWKTHAFLQSHDSRPIKFLATNVSLQYTAESFFVFKSPAKLLII